MKPTPRRLGPLLALVATACTTLVTETPAGQTTDAGITPPTAAASTEPRSCGVSTGSDADVDTGTLAGDAVFLSVDLFSCSDTVVVAGDTLPDVVAGSQLAAALGAPLLFQSAQLEPELDRLAPKVTYLVGSVDPAISDRPGLTPVNNPVAVDLARRRLGLKTVRLVSASDEHTLVSLTTAAIAAGNSVVLPTAGADGPSDALDPAHLEATASAWIVDTADLSHRLLAAVYGKTTDASVVTLDTAAPLADVGAAHVISEAERLRIIGPAEPIGAWERNVLANGPQVAGGGYAILPSQPRRYVAFYGHPATPALGVLGEQTAEEVLPRMRPLLTEYQADGAQVVPAFEIIASIASTEAGTDGAYSIKTPVETLIPLIETAEANQALVLLDLQPGRQDFLSQAMFYQELLKRPSVGLALDPEWRLKPGQVHLHQVGTVDAEEVNTVINWLADLVRGNGLPQKMLLLHMFKNSMITNRELLVDRPEIQVVIHMDGSGVEDAKDWTYRALMRDFEDAFWSWGWKNFFDEDIPGPPAPDRTISKEPSPVFISYQ